MLFAKMLLRNSSESKTKFGDIPLKLAFLDPNITANYDF